MRPNVVRSLPFVAMLAIASVLGTSRALDGGTLRVETFNGWRAVEVISEGDNPAGDGSDHVMPARFDGAGAWMVDEATLRVQVNHENSDASVSEVDLDLESIETVIANVRTNGAPGNVRFVRAASQAYRRWSADGGSSFTDTTSASNTSFTYFCSAQAYAPEAFGSDRGFLDQLYITGEETAGGRLFVLDSVARDLYALSGVVGSAPGGIGGMPFDSWENAALVDTGETSHVALLLSPDGGTQRMVLYVGDKGLGTNGSASTSFLARNGLAYGRWFYLNGSLPGIGTTNQGTFDTTSAGSLSSDKLEDIDTSPSAPDRVVLGDQTSGVFVLDFDLVFNTGGFDAGASDFAVTRISNTSGGVNSVNGPDNVDWTAPTTLGGNHYGEGLIFVNEDNADGEIWQMQPDGSNRIRIGKTTVGSESTGIVDISAFVGFNPGSVLLSNGQGSPSSMTLLIHPDATLTPPVCGDGRCEDPENAGSCSSDCPTACGDGLCTGDESAGNCGDDCPTSCGDGLCTSGESAGVCAIDCPSLCGDGLCTQNETASSCSGDCPTTCGDNLCTGGEDASSCLGDCPTTCGDGVCAGVEDLLTCAADCPATCGDGMCTGAEDATSCEADCGTDMPPGGGGGGCAVSAVSAAQSRTARLLMLFAVGVLLARRRSAKPRSRV